jgi:hypothetical protein
LLPGANALDTADSIKTKMRQLESRFPMGLHRDRRGGVSNSRSGHGIPRGTGRAVKDESTL